LREIKLPSGRFCSRVQELLPPPANLSDSFLASSRGHGLRRWSRWRDAQLLGRFPGMARMTNRRIEWLIRQAEGKGRPRETMGQMAARWGVSPRRLRQLRQLWRETGRVPALNPRRRPPGPPLTADQERSICEERSRNPRGATKIYQALLRQGIRIPKMQIYRFMKTRGWVTPNIRKQRRRTRVRYERAHSGSLLHGDYHRTDEERPHCILWEDDASRLVLSGGEFGEATTGHAIETLAAALRSAAQWGLQIREVNTDRGTQFFANPRAGIEMGEGEFHRFLAEQGVRHVVSRRNNPQTNGKLERLWLEYDRHRWRYQTLPEFIEWHNRQIHGSLWIEQLETPVEAWQRKMPPDVQLGRFLRLVEVNAREFK
jgi:putative transposase